MNLDAPAGQVLAATTTDTPVFGVGTAVSTVRGDIPTGVAHAYTAVSSFYGFGAQPDPVKAILVMAWLALNVGAFILVRRRAAHGKRTAYFPVTLGAHTYRSDAGLGA